MYTRDELLKHILNNDDYTEDEITSLVNECEKCHHCLNKIEYHNDGYYVYLFCDSFPFTHPWMYLCRKCYDDLETIIKKEDLCDGNMCDSCGDTIEPGQLSYQLYSNFIDYFVIDYCEKCYNKHTIKSHFFHIRENNGTTLILTNKDIIIRLTDVDTISIPEELSEDVEKYRNGKQWSDIIINVSFSPVSNWNTCEWTLLTDFKEMKYYRDEFASIKNFAHDIDRNSVSFDFFLALAIQTNQNNAISLIKYHKQENKYVMNIIYDDYTEYLKEKKEWENKYLKQTHEENEQDSIEAKQALHELYKSQCVTNYSNDEYKYEREEDYENNPAHDNYVELLLRESKDFLVYLWHKTVKQKNYYNWWR